MTLELIEALLFILLYFLALVIGGIIVWVVLATAGGVIAAVASIPLLYLFPDVQRFLEQIVTPSNSVRTPPWKLVVRPRYIGLGVAFGAMYLLTLLFVAVPLAEVGVLDSSIGPIPVAAVIPVLVACLSVSIAYTAHVRLNIGGEPVSHRSILGQWIGFVIGLVVIATLSPLLTVRLVIGLFELFSNSSTALLTITEVFCFLNDI